jgi:hypothetical protein
MIEKRLQNHESIALCAFHTTLPHHLATTISPVIYANLFGLLLSIIDLLLVRPVFGDGGGQDGVLI